MENQFKKWAEKLGSLAVLLLLISLLWGVWDYRNPVPWQTAVTLLIFIVLCLYVLDYGDNND